MDPMTNDEVQELLGVLEQIYPQRIGTGNPAQTLRVWSALLLDADAAQVGKAAIIYMREANPHPPMPGQLLEMIKAEDSTSSFEAWGTVLREIQNEGHSGTPNLDPLTLDVIRAVGGEWGSMCQSLRTSEVPALRARFLQAYTDMAQRKGRRDNANALLTHDANALPLVTGLAEIYDPDNAKSRKSGR